MNEEYRCGSKYKRELKQEIQELLRLYKNKPKIEYKTSFIKELSEESFSIDSDTKIKNTYKKATNCYRQRVGTLREKLDDMKTTMKYINNFPRKKYQNENLNITNKCDPMQMAVFNTNVYINKKKQGNKKNSIMELTCGKSVDINLGKTINTNRILVEREYENELGNEGVDMYAQTSFVQGDLEFIEDNAHVDILPKEIQLLNANDNSEIHNKSKRGLCEEEVNRLNNIKKSVEEIKSKLNEYSKNEIHFADFYNGQTIKNDPEENFNIQPKQETKHKLKSVPPKVKQNEYEGDLKKWHNKKMHTLRKCCRQKYCGTCIELLHRGYSSNDCPTHTQA